MKETFDMLDETMRKSFGRAPPEDCSYRSGVKKYLHLVLHATKTDKYPCDVEDPGFGGQCGTCKHRSKSIGL